MKKIWSFRSQSVRAKPESLPQLPQFFFISQKGKIEKLFLCINCKLSYLECYFNLTFKVLSKFLSTLVFELKHPKNWRKNDRREKCQVWKIVLELFFWLRHRLSPTFPISLHFSALQWIKVVFFFSVFCSICEDEEYEREDKGCWTGDRIGEYTHGVIATGANSQKYNPEVPLENPYRANTKINELVDKLINLRQTVANAVSH